MWRRVVSQYVDNFCEVYENVTNIIALLSMNSDGWTNKCDDAYKPHLKFRVRDSQ